MHRSIIHWVMIAAFLLICISCAPLSRGSQPPPAAPSTISAPTETSGNRENSFGMVFVHIPAGSFVMGSPENETGRDQGERAHQVTLTKDFHLQRTEVTQQQWLAVMGSNPSFFRNCGMNCPTESISWIDAQNFIEKLNHADTQYTYRLPTEAEWEHAARAGTTSAIPTGNLLSSNLFHDNNLDAVAWYVGNSEQGTHPVGQKQPNRWGLYDMHGNVREWCADWYHVYPFNGLTDPVGPQTGWSKIIRGGSWNLYTRFSRSASRNWTIPSSRDPFTGLRLVQTEKPPKPPEHAQPIVETALPRPSSWEVQFDYDKAEITPAMASILAEILAVCKTDDLLMLAGHTCALGTNSYNLSLSKERVATVRQYLIAHGIKPTQIETEFFGEEKPGYSNATEDGRSHNRRVTVRLTLTH